MYVSYLETYSLLLEALVGETVNDVRCALWTALKSDRQVAMQLADLALDADSNESWWDLGTDGPRREVLLAAISWKHQQLAALRYMN
jgi:hypothetical protein